MFPHHNSKFCLFQFSLQPLVYFFMVSCKLWLVTSTQMWMNFPSPSHPSFPHLNRNSFNFLTFQSIFFHFFFVPLFLPSISILAYDPKKSTHLSHFVPSDATKGQYFMLLYVCFVLNFSLFMIACLSFLVFKISPKTKKTI